MIYSRTASLFVDERLGELDEQFIFRVLCLFWLQWRTLRRRISRRCTKRDCFLSWWIEDELYLNSPTIPCRNRSLRAIERPTRLLEFSNLHVNHRRRSSRPRSRRLYQSIGNLHALRVERPCCGWMDRYPRISCRWKCRCRPCGP